MQYKSVLGIVKMQRKIIADIMLFDNGMGIAIEVVAVIYLSVCKMKV